MISVTPVATEKISSMISLIDVVAKKAIIHKNKASNLKSRLAVYVNKLA